VLAFDLGGTRLKAGVVDVDDGSVHGFTTADVHGLGADAALAEVDRVGHALLGNDLVVSQPEGVGLSVPGIVDDGTITSLPGKFDGIVGRDLRALLSHVFGLPSTVANDALCYGAGEARFGGGAGGSRVLVVTIGTGVGVAVYEDGLPLGRGPLGAGILGGHIPFAEDIGPVDTNGRRGTIEARCAAAAIVHEATAAGLGAVDVREVYAAHAAGDERAMQAIDAYRGWLTRALVALAHAHGPDVVVLGGGPIRADDPVVDGLEARVNDLLWPGYELAVRRATLGDHASLVGVAHLCAQERSR
jgi:glucokinase